MSVSDSYILLSLRFSSITSCVHNGCLGCWLMITRWTLFRISQRFFTWYNDEWDDFLLLTSFRDWDIKFHCIPPYNLDLASSDYEFGSLKDSLKGWIFRTNDEVKEVVNFWLNTQLNTFVLWWNNRVYCNNYVLKISSFISLIET